MTKIQSESANLQDYDWNDLKFFLALHRAGTFAEAARISRVDETTVARRIKRLEEALGEPLLLRQGSGRYELTDAGAAILGNVERVEAENHALRERIGEHSDSVVGVVRISAVPYITNRILIPNLPALQAVNPDLTLELTPEARNIDLTKREADLAVRFSRPSDGGMGIKARKLGDMAFDVFCSSAVPVSEEEKLDWISYDDAHALLPQSQWIEKLRLKNGRRPSCLRLADLESVQRAVICGYGKSILPRLSCLADKRLRLARVQNTGLEMKRAVWLLSHATLAERTSITVAKQWLVDLPWSDR